MYRDYSRDLNPKLAEPVGIKQ